MARSPEPPCTPRHTAFRGIPQRQSSLRRRAESRVEQLRMAPALPQLRRDRALRANIGAWYCAGQWLVSRTVGLERRKGPLRQGTCRPRPARDRVFRRLCPDRRDRRSWTAGPSAVVFNDLYDGQAIEHGVTRTPGWSEASPTRLGPACTAELDFGTLTPLHRSARPPAGRASPGHDLDVPSGQNARRFGQNLVGWVRVQVQGPLARRSRSVTPRCSRTMNSGRGPCGHPGGDGPLHPQWRR